VGWTPLSDPIDESRILFDNGVKDQVEAAGGEYIYCSPSRSPGAAGDPAAQADCVENFIAQGLDAIAIYPVDIVALGPVIKKANEAGIPVFDFTSPAPADLGVEIALTIQNNDRLSGQILGQFIVDALTEKYGEPKGTVLEVQGLMTTQAAIDRGGGFHDVVDEYPNIKVTSKDAAWDSGKAGPIIRDYLTANPNTDAVYFHSDGAYTPPTKATLEELGLWVKQGDPKKVILAGQDGSNLALHSLKCGYVDAINDIGIVSLGSVFGKLIVDYLQTGKAPEVGSTFETGDPLFPKATVVEKPEFAGPLVLTDILPVTAENVESDGLFGNRAQQEPNGKTAC